MRLFTMISFWLTGISFFLCGIAALTETPSPWLLRVALLSAECAAPTSLLISAVVKYVLWPQALAQGSSNTEIFKDPQGLLKHNGTVVMWLLELGLLGGLPIEWSHIAVAPLWGIAYVYFAWFMADKWSKPSDGPQFIYPFFDTTLGVTTSIALVALLLVLMTFYAVLAFAEQSLQAYEWEAIGSLGTNVLFMIATVLLVCRFRD